MQSTLLIIIPGITAPSAPPTSFEIDVINATSIFLSWGPPPEEERNGIIRQYVVELKTAKFDNFTSVSTGTNVTATNLHPYTMYECTVAAETIVVGVSSSSISALTYESGSYFHKVMKQQFVIFCLTYHSSNSSSKGFVRICGKSNSSAVGVDTSQRGRR